MRVGRDQLARWAIIQHYDVGKTPLLDVTQSPLVACSFAFLESQQQNASHFYFYVLGVPQISGAITISPTAELQIVRLNSVCPPDTMRPHFQEGYLVCTYPTVDSYEKMSAYTREEMDCAQRLIAKFRVVANESFWGTSFRRLDRTALYPTETSGLCTALDNLRSALPHA
jgi:hypothetical protein